MATQPCPCGRLGDPAMNCQCSAADIERYRTRLSGPLADRIDMHVYVGAVALAALGVANNEESSATIRERVRFARERQRVRYGRLGVRANAEVSGRWLLSHGGVSAEARVMLEQAAGRLGLSARGYHRTLRVARTIADLDGVDGVTEAAVGEALHYRAAPSTA